MVGIYMARWIGGRRIRRKGRRNDAAHIPALPRESQGQQGEGENMEQEEHEHRENTHRPTWLAVMFCLVCVFLDPWFGTKTNTAVTAVTAKPSFLVPDDTPFSEIFNVL